MRHRLRTRTTAVVAVAAATLTLAGEAQATPRRAAARPDVAVARVSVPTAAIVGTQFQVVVTLAERSRRVGAPAATVSVASGTSVATAPPVAVSAGGVVRVAVPVTLRTPGRATLAVHAAIRGDAVPRNNAAGAHVAGVDFALAPTEVLVDGFAGYGAQFNQHVYSGLSRAAGVSDANVGDMERKVVALAPQFVRLFFNRTALTDPDRMASFVRTAQLAQRAGATINVTMQAVGPSPDVDVPAFGHALADLVLNRGVTNLRWATIQNEVNTTRITMDQYDSMYRGLDATLTQDGVRDRVRFMGGDLVDQPSPLGQSQGDWFTFMATRMNDILDAYSVHAYWNYWGAAKIAQRLRVVRGIVDALPEAARKPVYVMEYGVRGHRPAGDAGPGTWDDGTPLESTNVSAFQQAWFALLAAKLGYSAAVKWDAYFARYDNLPQAYTMIGGPQEGWPLRPSYHLTRLLTSTTRPGWRVVGVDGSSGSKLVVGYAGPAGELTVLGLDTAGATLNGIATTFSTYDVGGFAPHARLSLVRWNSDGTGTVAKAIPLQANAAGTVHLGVPLQAVFALTTLPLS
jgi:hypothetical protein